MLNEGDLPPRELLAQVAQVHAVDDDDALGQKEFDLLLADIADLHQEAVMKLDAFGDFGIFQPALNVACLADAAGRKEAVRLVRAGSRGLLAGTSLTPVRPSLPTRVAKDGRTEVPNTLSASLSLKVHLRDGG
ncbi:MAG: hypothetical protein WDN03_02205 [Rhizomicrobium sp.]